MYSVISTTSSPTPIPTDPFKKAANRYCSCILLSYENHSTIFHFIPLFSFDKFRQTKKKRSFRFFFNKPIVSTLYIPSASCPYTS